MTRLALPAAVVAVFAALSLAALPETDARADGNACATKDFKTQLVKEACAKGGQQEAKSAMKAFAKEHKIKSCNECHSKLAPEYPLKKDALDQFKKLGGK